MEHTADLSQPIELTDEEKLQILRQRGDIPHEPHPQQEIIDRFTDQKRALSDIFDVTMQRLQDDFTERREDEMLIHTNALAKIDQEMEQALHETRSE